MIQLGHDVDVCFLLHTSINRTKTTWSRESSACPLTGPAPYPAEKESCPLLATVFVE